MLLMPKDLIKVRNMFTKDNCLLIKFLILFLLGLSHVIIKELIQVVGRGISLIFALTIPSLFILAGVFAGIVYWMHVKKVNVVTQHSMFGLFVFVLSIITFGMFPYAENH
jgi:hypothetical protein